MGSLDVHVVVPGMRLCPLEEDRYQSGPGTYAMHGYIYASLTGTLKMVPKVNAGEKDKDDQLMTVEVHSPKEETVVPAVGDIVTAKVLSVNQR
jgi:exosome complex component CSL4